MSDTPLHRPDRPLRRGRSPVKPVLGGVVAVAAIAVLFGVGAAAGMRGSGGPAGAGTTSSAPPPAPVHDDAPGLDEAVRDGRFEFEVSGVDCSRTTIGRENLKRTADGKYCVVSLSARNVGASGQYFVGRAQKAFDSAGGEHDTSELAGIYANQDTRAFLQRLDPGERVAGKLVFDVPKTVELTGLELHDSLLSDGVRVNLR